MPKKKQTQQPCSSNKATDQLPSLSSNLTGISNLTSVIDKVKNLHLLPSVQIFSITPEGKGICAIDVSQSQSHIAYSFLHSHEICLLSRKSLPDSIARKDLRTTWLNYVSARNQLMQAEQSEEKSHELLSSPQIYFIGHNDDVSGLRFSLDESILLSCSVDGSAKVITTTTYRVLENYDGYGSFTDIDVNNDTTQFVVASQLPCYPHYAAYLYRFERKSPILCFSGHENSLKCVRFHPNGLYLATAACDKSIKLWSSQQCKEVRSFNNEGGDVPQKITFSPDGKYIASTHGRHIKIWDIASGRRLKCLETSSSENCTLNISYNFDGSMLAVGGSDKQIHAWDIMSDGSPEIPPEYNLLRSEEIGKTIFSIKCSANFISCVTG